MPLFEAPVPRTQEQESAPAKWKRGVEILAQDVLLGDGGLSIIFKKTGQSLDQYLSDVEKSIKAEDQDATVEIVHMKMQAEDSEEGGVVFKRTIEEIAELPAPKKGVYKMFIFDGSNQTRALQSASAVSLDSMRDILRKAPGRVVMVWAEDSDITLPGEERPPFTRANIANCSSLIELYNKKGSA